MAAPTKGSCRLRSSRALGAAFEAHQRHALSLGERFQPEVRFSRLTCRSTDRPAPPSRSVRRRSTLSDDVRYPEQSGAHMLIESFTALDTGCVKTLA